MAFDNVPLAKKCPGSRFMTCFEKLKQDFGLTDNRDDRELSPLNLNIPDSEYYDGEESIVNLPSESTNQLPLSKLTRSQRGYEELVRPRCLGDH